MRSRVPRVLLLIVAITCFSSSATIRQPHLLILRLLPREKPPENPDGISGKWRMVQDDEYRTPQMRTHALKSRVSPDENWHYLDDSTEYKYSGPHYDSATNEQKIFARLENDENPGENDNRDVDDSLDNIVMPDQIVPPIGFRNIIVAPTFCQNGERPDSIGRCRPVLKCELFSAFTLTLAPKRRDG